MPQIRKNRTWCKTCQDWELFQTHLTSEDTVIIDTLGSEVKKTSKTTCDTCKSKYIPYSLDEVPEDKLAEQRERYSKMKFEEFKRFFSAYNTVAKVNTGGIFGSDSSYDETIKEDDAGQIAIDEAEKAAREAKRLADIEFKDKFRGAQRNSPCRCESGLKYKKCCLPIIEKIR